MVFNSTHWGICHPDGNSAFSACHNLHTRYRQYVYNDDDDCDYGDGKGDYYDDDDNNNNEIIIK